jgi:hypothetical protein
VVGIIEPGQVFGEECLNGQSVRIATASAMEGCLITSITKTAMTAILDDEPKFSHMFVAYLLSRNNRVEEDLIDQLFNSSEKRLARLLLLLANFGKEGSPQPIDANFDQGTLAEMIGTTRSRVSSFMNKFRKLGFISYNGKVEVHRSLLNAVLQERPQLERDESDEHQLCSDGNPLDCKARTRRDGRAAVEGQLVATPMIELWRGERDVAKFEPKPE